MPKREPGPRLRNKRWRTSVPSSARTVPTQPWSGSLQPQVPWIHRADLYRVRNAGALGKRITLREHQQAGAARLLAHGRTPCVRVGVGKATYGIATIAKLRGRESAAAGRRGSQRSAVSVAQTVSGGAAGLSRPGDWRRALHRTGGALVSRTGRTEERARSGVSFRLVARMW